MKALRTILCVFILISFLNACESENEPNTDIIITFDPSSTTVISDKGNMSVTGNIKSDPGTTIEEISVMCLYIGKDEAGKTKQIAELATSIGKHEIKKISYNEYGFAVTHENNVFSARLTTLYGMRINVRMKNGQRMSKQLSIRPQYKI